MEIVLIEFVNSPAREHWQQIQLRNLVNHATFKCSAFWRFGLAAGGLPISTFPCCLCSNTGRTCASRSLRKAHYCGQRRLFDKFQCDIRVIGTPGAFLRFQFQRQLQ